MSTFVQRIAGFSIYSLCWVLQQSFALQRHLFLPVLLRAVLKSALSAPSKFANTN